MRALFLLVPLAACSRGTPSANLPKGDAQRPDVIVLSIDTLRADHLGSYGYFRDTAPHLDALAAKGARFEQAWSPSPWTLPSHATMLTGLLPLRHGAIESDRAIAADAPRLPEAFQQAGYGTIGVVATWFVSDRYGFDRGFDSFYDFDLADEKENLKGQRRAETVFDEALARAAKQAEGEPIFLFLHVYDVHYGYEPPSPWDEKFDRANLPDDAKYKNYAHHLKHPLDPEQLVHQIAQYDEEIAYVDDRFHAFLQAWEGAGREAIVVVTSDHGEELGERGGWGHGHTLWPEQLHVPLVVSGPGVQARAIPDRVGLEDLAPTVAGLAGVPFPAGDGVDRSPLLRGEAVQGGPAAVYAETSRFKTLRMRWHQPPFDLQADLAGGTLQLCDLAADPTCRRDVASDHFDTVVAMEKAMYEWLGAPYVALESGVVESKGTFVVYGNRAGHRLVVEPGVRFALFPPDAAFSFRGGDGTVSGPWQALGGSLPAEEAPVRWEGRSVQASGVELGDEERAALEALGYVQ